MKKSSFDLEELTGAQKKAVMTLTRSVAEKIINDPILFLKTKASASTLDSFLDVTRKLFNLDEKDVDTNSIQTSTEG